MYDPAGLLGGQKNEGHSGRILKQREDRGRAARKDEEVVDSSIVESRYITE